MMRMKIFSKLPSVLTGVLLLLCGCKPSEGTAVQPAAEDLRILSTVTAADHIITELGCPEKIAAIDRHGKVLEAMQNVPIAAVGNTVSREYLKKYRINCAIIWYYQQDLYELLRKEKIYTQVIYPITLGTYPVVVEILGKLCNRQAQATELCRKFRNALSEKPTQGGKSVYLELYAPWKMPAPDGYIGSILQKAGGHLAVWVPNGGTVAPEAVYIGQPEVIFYVENFGSAREIASRIFLRETPAVKNNRIYAIPRQLVCEGVAPEKLLEFLSIKIKDN